MDLTAWLLRRTPVRPLIVAFPGGTAARLAVEQAAREWGWLPAVSPAEANMLVITGSASESHIDVVWQQLPLPRVKVQIDAAEDTRPALSATVAQLRDRRQQAESVAAAEPVRVEHTAMPSEPDSHEHGSHEHGSHEHGHDMQGHDMHGDHMHGHDMGGMEMHGGVPMADRVEDRDGLKLDVLHVSLGPVLSDWPAGLAVHATLQGDVLQEVSVEVIGQERASGYWTADRACARRLDSCARLLAVAGWDSAATQARRLRDDVLSGRQVGPAFDRWARRVRRSRVLRWLLVGLGEWGQTDAADRLVAWIEQADAALEGATGEGDDSSAVLAALPELLVGCELAGARLVVASLDPDTDQVMVRD
jgi:hypothetical protein